MLKYIPMIIALIYILHMGLSYFYIDIPVLSHIAGISLFPWVFMYIATLVFKFCLYHRIFLYYILIVDIINIIDYYIGIPISDLELLMVHIIILGILLFIILYSYVRKNKRIITENSE